MSADSCYSSVPHAKSCFEWRGFLFEKVTEDAWKFLEIVNRMKRGFVCFA